MVAKSSAVLGRAAGVAFFTLVFLLAVAARAHESRPAYMELRQESADTYALLWKVPARGLDQRLGLDVVLPDDCEVVEPARASFIRGAYLERSTIRREGGMSGAAIRVAGLPTTLTDVLVRVRRLDGSVQTARLTPAAPSFIVSGVSSRMDVTKAYTAMGVWHIWRGSDHLAFVACLMLIAGTGRRLLVTITGFTLSHSVTLALAALGWVRVPVPPVEAAVALSIVFLASEIARPRRDTLTWRFPIAVSASFGLLHGFGFASALRDIGLPHAEIPAALLSFNIGVEIGQLAFVGGILGCVFCVSRLLRRTGATARDWPQRIEKPLAYLVGAVAMYWTIERTASFWG